jgi:hypothetical protein
MREIVVNDDCHDLLAAEFPYDGTGRRLQSGKWQISISEETWRWLQKLQRPGETISDCVIRLTIITQHKRCWP